MGGDVLEVKRALSFLGAALAEGEQAAEPAVSRAIRRVSEQARGILQDEARAGDELDAHFLGGEMGPHHAGERIRVGDGDGLVAKRLRGRHQLFGVRAAAQKGEVRGDVELGIAGWGGRHHANTPCRNQHGASSTLS